MPSALRHMLLGMQGTEIWNEMRGIEICGGASKGYKNQSRVEYTGSNGPAIILYEVLLATC